MTNIVNSTEAVVMKQRQIYLRVSYEPEMLRVLYSNLKQV